ncbi:MAG: translational GTPase TypA [Planctomycetota bacterium]|nr:translational GTPase TypA [Planctomycetota bacterium]
MSSPQTAIRNIAIIAHVDHGKTTLVDSMLRASSASREVEGAGECVLDSNPLERERGITILAKNCAVDYTFGHGPRTGESIRVNIIDTPGHADFGGEVERVLRMADGCLLLVDAYEGPMPQTRFVLEKALRAGLKPIVIVNKCDKVEARPDEVVHEVFDLLIDLGADDVALDFPVLFASGRDGWASFDREDRSNGVRDLFQAVADRVPAPSGDRAGTLQFLVTNLAWSTYTGRIAIGRVYRGGVRNGQNVLLTKQDGSNKRTKVIALKRFEGLGRRDTDLVLAGDLCAIEGLEEVEIGDTVCDVLAPEAMERVRVDEPTLHMVFRINDGPFSGREGKYVTSRQISERLDRELEHNVALRVAPGEGADEFRVSGRGLLHLGVLLENMRREGFELTVGKPEVVEREIDGIMSEPWERLTVDVCEMAIGGAMEVIGQRGGEVTNVTPRGGRMHVEADMPARGLIGMRTRMLNATQGDAVMHHAFLDWRPCRPAGRRRLNGVLVSTETGPATTYALVNLAERGTMFVRPQDAVYEGMMVGEHNRDTDLMVNATRAKPFSNVREANKEATVVLKEPRQMGLEACLEFLEDDELVEITPTSVRMRKRMLKESDRKRVNRRDKDRASAATK